MERTDQALLRGAGLEYEGIPELEERPPGKIPDGLGGGCSGYLDRD